MSGGSLLSPERFIRLDDALVKAQLPTGVLKDFVYLDCMPEKFYLDYLNAKQYNLSSIVTYGTPYFEWAQEIQPGYHFVVPKTHAGEPSYEYAWDWDLDYYDCVETTELFGHQTKGVVGQCLYMRESVSKATKY